MADTTKKARNATPPVNGEEEHCECSRCGTIYQPFYFPTNCPGCWKRRTYKDATFPTSPFKKQ